MVVGPAEDAGRIVSDIERTGGRAAAFVGELESDDDRAALAEMLDELFARAQRPVARTAAGAPDAAW